LTRQGYESGRGEFGSSFEMQVSAAAPETPKAACGRPLLLVENLVFAYAASRGPQEESSVVAGSSFSLEIWSQVTKYLFWQSRASTCTTICDGRGKPQSHFQWRAGAAMDDGRYCPRARLQSQSATQRGSCGVAHFALVKVGLHFVPSRPLNGYDGRSLEQDRAGRKGEERSSRRMTDPAADYALTFGGAWLKLMYCLRILGASFGRQGREVPAATRR
jgi:hypothetical protein